jgi:hypothetical protein
VWERAAGRLLGFGLDLRTSAKQHDTLQMY